MKEGVRGIFTHGFMSFASVSVITTCLVLTGTVVLLMLTLTGTITDLGSSGDIRAYVDETLSDEESEAIENTLRAIPNVSGVDYIDRDRRNTRTRSTGGCRCCCQSSCRGTRRPARRWRRS